MRRLDLSGATLLVLESPAVVRLVTDKGGVGEEAGGRG